MAPQFTLYGNVGSITSERVRLMLDDQGFTDYEFVSLDFFKGDLKVGIYICPILLIFSASSLLCQA